MTKTPSPCCHKKQKFDFLLWISLGIIIVFYSLQLLAPQLFGSLELFKHFAHSIHDLVNIMWWGVVIGILMIALLSKVPSEFVISAFGNSRGLKGMIRATLAGVILDLCSHGILMVGSKLYERGASAGQVMAFLIASPWNSLSLTVILIALVGLFWTLAFILFSAVIAIITGLLFERLVDKGHLPSNNNIVDLPENFHFWNQARENLSNTRFTPAFIKEMLVAGIKDSRMVMRWLLFGIILASLVRTFLDTDVFQSYFGPTLLLGLSMTILTATIMEVCSEGSTPIAADLLNRANAPGNSFAFLMSGVSTDYTEIMVLKETTASWKLALFLPLITLPQIILISSLINLST